MFLKQYGVSVMKLSDLVDDFCLKQGNMREANYLKYLVFARWAWDELYRKSIWQIRRVALESCDQHTITLPNDCERLVNISVVDKFGRLHPLTPDSNFNTTEIKCQKCKCSCQKCNGENSLCSVIDGLTYTTSTVDVQGTPYTVYAYTRYSGNGTLQKEEQVPVYNTATSTVEYVTTFSDLCTLDIDEKGCIKPTQPNIGLLMDFCGWDGASSWWNGWSSNYRSYQNLIPAVYNDYGYWNYNANDRQIVHLFRGKCDTWIADQQRQDLASANGLHVKEDKFGTIIVSYQTNSEVPDTEILVPQYAVRAVQVGMIYQQRLYDPRDGDRDNGFKNKWRAERKDVMTYLNPVRMDTVEKLQTQKRPW